MQGAAIAKVRYSESVGLGLGLGLVGLRFGLVLRFKVSLVI